jgi:hypothetical protein
VCKQNKALSTLSALREREAGCIPSMQYVSHLDEDENVCRDKL